MRPATRSRITPALAGFFVGIALCLLGCATPQMEGLAQRWPADLPGHATVKGVPFFPQEDYECGPAALAMVLQTAGVDVLPAQLVDQVYLPGRKGSLQTELLVASRRNGVLPYVLQPTVEAVLREVAAGNPVLVFQNLGMSVYPVWHYAVVIGFDRERNVLVLHSGRTAQQEMSLFAFERTWARGDYWAVVALAPSRLPATAQVAAYTQAVVALERSQIAAARVAYAAAVHRWPGERVLMLGQGNAAYAMGDLAAATRAYTQAVQAHPDFADGWNNLAQVLWEQHQPREALAAVRKAIALGGPRLSAYQDLQHTITHTPIRRK